MILTLGAVAVPLSAKTYHVGDRQRGYASWYGYDEEGRATANGEIFHPDQFTAAHRTLPFNTIVEVYNLQNGRRVKVRINDRGPYGYASRIIDLSQAAARRIGLTSQGTVKIELRVLKVGPTRRED